MADIINLADRRKKEAPAIRDIVDDAISYVSDEWEKNARANRLNEYVADALKVWSANDVMYTQGLNAISNVEGALGMVIIVKSPYNGQIGWKAGFVTKSLTCFTPDLPFESYARCFNVLVFLKVKRDLQLYDIRDEL
jgi:hypothetical protein